jgi:CMP-N-acetylneuraminic acid synthetase
MIEKSDFIAIIPARAGSKRLPGKNRLLLAGKPLIEWTIQAALDSGCFDRILVTTDDLEIIDLAKKMGVWVPFVRPAELSSDTVSSYDVVAHALTYVAATGKVYRSFCLLQGTSPLRTAADIQAAILLYNVNSADAVNSVCEMDHSPLWSNTLPSDLSMNDFIDPEVNKKRSQDLPIYYRQNGAIYICDIGRFLVEKDFLFRSNSFAYIMAKDHSVDIDDYLDLLTAETLLSRSNEKQ